MCVHDLAMRGTIRIGWVQEFRWAVLKQDEAAQRAALGKCRAFSGFPAELLLEAADMAADLGGRAALPVACEALQLGLQEQIAHLKPEGLAALAQATAFAPRDAGHCMHVHRS